MLRRARGGQITRRRAATVARESPSAGGAEAKKEAGGLLQSYLRALDKKPLITKIITSGVICGAGDIMAQGLAFRSNEMTTGGLGAFVRGIDLQRLNIYALLGAVYIAPLIHYWFNALEAIASSPEDPPKTKKGRVKKAAKMVTIDQTIGAPICNAG